MRINFGTFITLVVLFLGSTIGVVDGAVNLISNPGFESGTTSWGFYTSGTGTFTTPSPGYEGIKSAKLALSSTGTNIQLFQTGVALEANTKYRLSFAAYSNTGHDMTVKLFKHVSPFTTYMPEFTVNLGTSWQTFTTEFTSSGFSGTVNDGRFMFWLAQYGAGGDAYYIDAIVLEKVGADTSPPIVIGKTPTGTGVPVNTKITVTFNESMNPTTAQAAFSTSPATSGSFVWSGNVMTYTPSSNLVASTTYNVAIGTGAKDLAGNSLQSPYSWSFTTSGASSSIEARLAALEANMSALKAENTALKNLLANVSRNGNDIYIDGANLHIRDGSGDTAGPVNGLGNLIIGYNEHRAGDSHEPPENRTGSHNIILGMYNNYQSYGGFVSGNFNEISGAGASVIGGGLNSASGGGSSIIGGSWNSASGSSSRVIGGGKNTASGDYSSVSGGEGNTASGDYSSVSGGTGNTASGSLSSISGGWVNTASGYSSSVSGGYQRNATGQYDWVAGLLFQDK